MVAIGAPQEKIFLIASFFKIFNEKKYFSLRQEFLNIIVEYQ